MDSIRPVDITNDVFLSSIMLEEGNQLEDYRCTEMASNIAVPNRTGKFHKWPAKTMYGPKGTGNRNPSGQSETIEFGHDSGTYSLAEIALNVSMSLAEMQDYRGPQGWEMIMTRFLTRALFDLREKAFATLISPTNLLAESCPTILTCVDATTDLTLTRWNIDGSDPFIMLGYMVKEVRKNCGRYPNVLGLPFEVALTLQNNSAFIDRYKYFAPTAESIELPAKIKGMKPVVLGAMTTTGNEGDTSVTLTDMYGSHAWCAYIDPLPMVQSMTALARFFLEFEPYGTNSWDWPNKRGKFVESFLIEQFQIVAPGAIAVANEVDGS